jgi:hypothetical protein
MGTETGSHTVSWWIQGCSGRFTEAMAVVNQHAQPEELPDPEDGLKLGLWYIERKKKKQNQN